MEKDIWRSLSNIAQFYGNGMALISANFGFISIEGEPLLVVRFNDIVQRFACYFNTLTSVQPLLSSSIPSTSGLCRSAKLNSLLNRIVSLSLIIRCFCHG